MVPFRDTSSPFVTRRASVLRVRKYPRQDADIVLMRNRLGERWEECCQFAQVSLEIEIVYPPNPMGVHLGVHLIASQNETFYRVDACMVNRNIEAAIRIFPGDRICSM